MLSPVNPPSEAPNTVRIQKMFSRTARTVIFKENTPKSFQSYK